MFRYVLSIISLLFVTSVIAADYKTVTVGIVTPIKHPALDEIVKGFEEELIKEYPGKINFVVRNAQGDINLQRSIIQGFNQDQTDLIVPISTSTTQMTAAIVTKKPIVSLAAIFSEAERQKHKVKNIVNIDDESGVAVGIKFCFEAIPSLHKVTIIHSVSDKIMIEVATFNAIAKTYGINVQDLMIQQLPDLYSASSKIAQDSQAIFILKDNLVASGINTLVKAANKKHMPLISSDNITVENGAAFAVGVKEYQVGIEGAKLATQILCGSDVSKLPMKILDNFFIFVNKKAISQQGVDLERIKFAAKKYKYQMVALGEKL